MSRCSQLDVNKLFNVIFFANWLSQLIFNCVEHLLLNELHRHRNINYAIKRLWVVWVFHCVSRLDHLNDIHLINWKIVDSLLLRNILRSLTISLSQLSSLQFSDHWTVNVVHRFSIINFEIDLNYLKKSNDDSRWTQNCENCRLLFITNCVIQWSFETHLKIASLLWMFPCIVAFCCWLRNFEEMYLKVKHKFNLKSCAMFKQQRNTLLD